MPIHEGWLKKKSPGFGGGWQERYFVLEADSLAYGKKPGAKVAGRIPAVTVIMIAALNDKKGVMFDVLINSCTSEETYTFSLQALDSASCKTWIDKLEDWALGKNGVPEDSPYKGKFWKNPEDEILGADPSTRKAVSNEISVSVGRPSVASPGSVNRQASPSNAHPAERKVSQAEKKGKISGVDSWKNESPITTGMLKKRKAKGMKGWQIRHFVLYPTALLYYKKGATPDQPAGAIPVYFITNVVQEGALFTITTDTNAGKASKLMGGDSKSKAVRTYELQAKSAATATSWIEHIKKAMVAAKPKPKTASPDLKAMPTPPSGPRPPAGPKPPSQPKPPGAKGSSAGPPSIKEEPLHLGGGGVGGGPKVAAPVAPEPIAAEAPPPPGLSEEEKAAIEAERKAKAEAEAQAKVEYEQQCKVLAEQEEKRQELLRQKEEERLARIEEARKIQEEEDRARENAEAMIMTFANRRVALSGSDSEEEGGDDDGGDGSDFGEDDW